jgi:NTP pyrophosphatase (non-canonical NTP hydrolase)
MTPPFAWHQWRRHALHIHSTVAKRWVAWSEEDKRFLTLALCGEVGELANLVKKEWRGDGARTAAIREELVDVRIYLELLAVAFGVDLDRACMHKIPELYNRWPEVRPLDALAALPPTDGGTP